MTLENEKGKIHFLSGLCEVRGQGFLQVKRSQSTKPIFKIKTEKDQAISKSVTKDQDN